VSGELRVSERDPRTVAPSSLRGKFSALAGKLVVLWNDGERLHVHVDEQRFVLDDDVSVEYQIAEPAVFSIRRAGEVLLRWEYASPSLRWAKMDPTWSDTQYEDFDFGYYIADACADVQKRRFVHCLASRPEVLGSSYFILDELRGLIAPPIATLREVRRWSWRWEQPFVGGIGSFCSFCTCEGDRPGPEPGDLAARLHAVRLHDRSQVMVCQWCVACCYAALDGTGPSADPARVLDELSGALTTAGVAHAGVLRAALERGCALATPAALPPGTACSGCGRNDQRVARAPAVSLCARCLPAKSPADARQSRTVPDADLASITAALAALVDAKLSADYSPWYPGAGQDPPRIDIYASEERGAELHVRFIADSFVYNQAQSGSDWADHYVYAGGAACKGPALRAQRFALVEHVPMSESQSNNYNRDATVARVRERIVATPAPIHELIRCPNCGSINAGISELVFAQIRMKCHACGHTELTDREGLEATWTIRV
jgi:hypothetical protein